MIRVPPGLLDGTVWRTLTGVWDGASFWAWRHVWERMVYCKRPVGTQSNGLTGARTVVRLTGAVVRWLGAVCFVVAAAASVCLSPASCGAQGMPELDTSYSVLLTDPTEEEPDGFSLGVTGGYVGAANFASGRGGVETARVRVSARYNGYRLSYTHTDFLWNDLDSLPFGGGAVPWKDLNEVSLSGGIIRGSFWEDWHYVVGGDLTMAFESDFPGAVGAGLNGELAYNLWEGWMLGGVARVRALNALNNDLFGEVEVGVALHVSRKHLRELADELGLSGDMEAGGTRIDLRFEFAGADKTYRLSPGNGYAPHGYAGIRNTRVSAFADIRISPNATLSVGPEYWFFRQYTIYNDAGSQMGTYDLGEAFGGSVGFSWSF